MRNIYSFSRNLAAVAGLGLLAGLVLPQLKADEIDKKVVMTFSAPVEIPGRVLPAGTYVFKELSRMNPGTIVVMNEDQTKVMGIQNTVPEYWPTTPEDVHVNFAERPGGRPEAVKSWTYPGYNYGFAFVYPGR